MGKNLVASEPAAAEKLPESAIREELSRILESSIFGQSDRLGRFLRFTVEKTLEGESKLLKEYLIGTEVYERQPPYDPSNDSIVRSEARRLRAKLKEYYESVGRNDSIFIYYRPGSYVPVFKKQESDNTESNRRDGAADGLFTEGRGVKVAVLPFVDTSQGELSGAYAKVITDELIHGLVRTDGLRVTAASSVAPLLTQNLDIPALARKLDVQVFFEGTVRDDNDHLRVTSSVVNADGFHLWSERFETERDPHGVFEVSEKIVSAFLSRIRPEQSLIRKQKAAAAPSLLAAYSSVLAAEASLDEGTLEDTESALSKFEQITEIEPEYARPFCGIARCHCEMALRGIPNSASAVSRAMRAATHAAKLDPQMRLVPACMACALALSWKWRDAERYFQEALGLGEHADALREYALLLAALGRFDKSWSYLEKAQEIDPFSYRQKIVYAKMCHLSRQYDRGLKQVMTYGPVPVESEIFGAMMLIALDRHDEAKQIAESVLRKAGGRPVLMAAVAEILLRCGQASAADRIVKDYDLLSSQSPISKFRQALLSIALDDSKKAISLVSAAYNEREAELIWLAQDPRFDAIREDPTIRILINNVMGDATTAWQVPA